MPMPNASVPRIEFRSCIAAFIAVAMAMPALAWDCKRSATPAERLICSNPRLTLRDKGLNALYRAVSERAAGGPALRSEQRAWLQQRNTCTDEACMARAYVQRTRELTRLLAPWCRRQAPAIAGSWQRVGSAGFFETFSAGPDGSFDSWAHLAPEIAAGTWRLDGCALTVQAPGGWRLEMILIDASRRELRLLDDQGGLEHYRAASH